MATPITLRDIARRAGVHLTTAARAVKDDPRVRPETAARIKALARKLGYVPDPMLSALNAYRHAKRPSRYRENVAWVTNYETSAGWEMGAFLYYYAGAAEALRQHGYTLEHFWLREPGLTAHRASQVLASRGIRGLLCCPLQVTNGHLSLDWKKFCAMTFGYSLVRPQLHLVTSSHFQATISCLRRLRALGYRRIGLVMPAEMDQRMDKMWSAAYVTHVPGKPLPLFHELGEETEAQAKMNQRAFLAWCRRERPDAIITNTGSAPRWLEQAGYRVPEEIGVAIVNLQEGETHASGIVESARDIGRAAGNFLAAMMQRGEYGIPAQPQRILLDGHWVDGPTTRALSTLPNTPARAERAMV